VDNVLGLARTGLIFTKSQEGSQPCRLTPPGQTELGIPYHVPSCWFSVRGELGSGKAVAAREHTAAVGESSSLCSTLLFCVVSLSVSLLFLFPLFAVLLNCPYPNPPFFCLFFLFSSAPQQGEGRPRVAFVAGHNQTITDKLAGQISRRNLVYS